MPRIVFISPYRDLTLLGQKIASELNIKIETYEGSLDQAVEIMNNLKGPEVDVYISRRSTVKYIAANTNVPVISVTTGPMDILDCCIEARKFSRKIAITVSPNDSLSWLETFEKLLDISITRILISNMQECKDKIKELVDLGVYCLVSGGLAVTYARQIGLPSVFLKTSPESVREALLKAQEIALLSSAEKAKAFRLKAIMDSVYEGIIAIDEHRRVEVFNHAAEKILGIKSEKVLGNNVTDAIPDLQLENILMNSQPEISEIYNLDRGKIISNRIPVRNGHQTIGAVATFQDISRVVKAERKIRKGLTDSHFYANYTFNDIVGISPAMQNCKSVAKNFAASDLTVFIYGPTGVGKELFAQSIHNGSDRVSQPFVAVNCGALPPALLESELFGYEEGAFTGAKHKGKHGLFELAHGGTIFLDEVDSLPLDLQVRLLRVLQEREVLRVGGESIIKVDIRVISATNTPPRKLLKDKKLRADLFYRLNVLYLELPALAERTEDIEILCKQFLPRGFLDSADHWFKEILPFLKRYSWPGNVRELHNFTQRMLFYFRDNSNKDALTLLRTIAPDILDEVMRDQIPTSTLQGELIQKEMDITTRALKDTGSVKEAAKILGISERTLWRNIKKFREYSPDFAIKNGSIQKTPLDN